jgi:hypothetical protein
MSDEIEIDETRVPREITRALDHAGILLENLTPGLAMRRTDAGMVVVSNEGEDLAVIPWGRLRLPDPQRSDPAPVDFEADAKVIEAVLVGTFEEAYPDLVPEMRAGELTLTLAGFDAEGLADVTVFRRESGEQVFGARIHWSVLQD